MDHLCYLCLVFANLSRLFIAALWSPEGKGMTSCLLFVMFIVILLRFLILAVFLILIIWQMVQYRFATPWTLFGI